MEDLIYLCCVGHVNRLHAILMLYQKNMAVLFLNSFLSWLERAFSSVHGRLSKVGAGHVVPLPESSNYSGQLEFNAFFCFFSFGKHPFLIHSGHKGMKFSEAELRALVMSSHAELNRNESLNIISDYMKAVCEMDGNKQLMLQLRSAGWDALLASLLSTYVMELQSCFDSNFRSGITKVDVYFLISPSSSDTNSIANSCFSAVFSGFEAGSEGITLKNVVEDYLRMKSC